MADESKGLGCPLKHWIIAGSAGLVVAIAMMLGGYAWMAAMFVGAITAGLIGLAICWLVCCPGERKRAPASEPVDPLSIVSSDAPAAPAPAPAPAKAEAEPAPAPKPEPKPVPAADPAPAGGDTRPVALSGPREGGADDLKKIKGVGPKLEQLLNSLGFYHFDQIAGWSASEVAWVDENLKGFKGRVSRDGWVEQSAQLAAGGETEFSKKVDKGGVY